MKHRLVAFAALVAASFPVAASAQTVDTLEVISGPNAKRAVAVGNYDPLGQSFTAFAEHLTSFGFQFQLFNESNANLPFTFQLLAGEGLTGSIVATRTFTLPTALSTTVPSWFDIDLTGTDVALGEKYTAVLSTGNSLRYGIVLGPEVNIYTGEVLGTDAYAGGTALFSADNLFHDYPYSNFCGTSGICDLNFRASGYNDVAAVPEPAAWGMMIGGFAVAGGALRRRRRGLHATPRTA